MVNDLNESKYKKITSYPLCSNEDLVPVLQNPSDKVLHTESFYSQINFFKDVMSLSNNSLNN